mmetsp:Transcript_42182/g.91931  ORF Transcript_42182/g.91931 Transcript_42182/m.91931 type:complete len:107 (-) Transcript_42182:95-415(-)
MPEEEAEEVAAGVEAAVASEVGVVEAVGEDMASLWAPGAEQLEGAAPQTAHHHRNYNCTGSQPRSASPFGPSPRTPPCEYALWPPLLRRAGATARHASASWDASTA